MFGLEMPLRSGDGQRRSPRSGLAAGLIAFAIVLSAAFAQPAAAEPNNHVLRQITNITVGEIWTPKIRSQDGNSIAFVSTGDVLGLGTSTAMRQIYYWSEETDTITQVTNGTTCESYDPTRPMDGVFAGGRPEVITFVSTCDLDPTRDNSDGNAEIFFWEIASGTFHQMTDTPATVTNANPFLSDSGRCLVFSSNGDLDDNIASNPNYDSNHPGPGYANIDGSREVFMYSKMSAEEDLAPYPRNGTFTQLSNGPAGTNSEKPVIGGYWFARQCQTTAWQSDHDQLGTGRVGTHIWLYRRPASQVEEMVAIHEIPNGFPAGQYTNPFISSASPFARGPHIAFEVVPDLWNNGSEGMDVFNFRVFHPRLTQFTDTGRYSDPAAETLGPNVSDGGGVFAYYSSGEHVGQKRHARVGGEPPFNADGNFEIFRLKGRRRIYQLTKTEGCDNTQPFLDDAGRRFTWRSTCDLIPGENITGRNQVFLWSLEKNNAPLVVPGGCVQADGCCKWERDGSGCYEPVFGKKPKPARPNCVERSLIAGKDRCG